MLEVGRVEAPIPGAFFSWNRAHFGGWCIVSSPLILAFNLSDATRRDLVWDIITNHAGCENNFQETMPGVGRTGRPRVGGGNLRRP